ncbi:MAG: hypothetical protein ACOX8G_10020 [Eubacterium sp.]|jgi:hypothetical protein
MKKEKKLLIYQSTIIIAAAILIALVPTLLVWTFHVLTLDPAVIIGLVCCYAFTFFALRAGLGFLMKARSECFSHASGELAHEGK